MDETLSDREILGEGPLTTVVRPSHSGTSETLTDLSSLCDDHRRAVNNIWLSAFYTWPATMRKCQSPFVFVFQLQITQSGQQSPCVIFGFRERDTGISVKSDIEQIHIPVY